jgi:integrase/recombinase XerD
MTPIAPHITAFMRERLPIEKRASVHTCDSYAYAFQLLFEFASAWLKVAPSELSLETIDAPLVLAFLQHLETKRGNGASSRNARLAAIRSFFRFVEYRVPSALDQVRRVLAIPMKRVSFPLVDYLTAEERQAVLDAPDPHVRSGVRDRAMLHLAFASGVRVSELVGLRLDDLTLRPRVCLLVRGKGRRERLLPLWKETTAALRSWLAIRGDVPAAELFLNARGAAMTRSGFEYVLDQHVAHAAKSCSSLETKRVSPHVLRHTCAMFTLQATRDIRDVALWLGHASVQTTETYLRADPTQKFETMASLTPPHLRRGRFRPPDKLLASLRPARGKAPPS